MKNYNKIMILTGLVIGLFGQAQEKPVDKIRSLKVAYITDQLSLTPAEAEKFWPLYNQYDEKLHEIRMTMRQKYGKKHDSDTVLSEKEAEANLKDFLDLQDKKQQTTRDMVNEMLAVIPASKVIKLLKAEEGFKRKMFKNFRKHKGRIP